MGDDWRRVQITEVCDLIVDCVNKTAPTVDGPTPYKMLRTPNVKGGRVSTENCRYVEEEVFTKWTRRAGVRFNDVLLTREAPLGEVGIVKSDENLFLGQRLMQYRVNDSVLDPDFLVYAFLSNDLQHQFTMHEGSGSVVSHIRVGDCSKFELNLPPLNEQKKIAGVLSTLDQKIELNRQINTTLESMAQALFKSWFVDFDPVIDNALAAGNEIPEPLQAKAQRRAALGNQRQPLPTEIQQLFPSSFVFNEDMGWVPEGWEESPVSKLCGKIQNGGTPKRDNPSFWDNGAIPWLASGEVRQTIIVGTEKCITDLGLKNSSAKWLPAFSTVIAMYGATAGQVALISKELTTNQAVCGLIPKDECAYYIYLTMSRITGELSHQARGSAQQNISKGIVESTRVVIPPIEIMKSFNLNVEPLFRKWIGNIEQQHNLASIRDLLLPKLLSGKLQIPEAEAAVEEALEAS